MKKKLVLLTAVIICLFAFCMSASAVAENRPYSEKDYKIIDNVVYALEKDGKSYYVEDYFATNEAAKIATEVNIVKEIDGIPVTKIYVWQEEAENIYLVESLPNIKKITIPGSITHIEGGSFASLDGVTTIELPEAVSYIGAAAFYKMESLEKIVIPSKVTEIEENLCAYSAKLKSVVIKGKVTTIDFGAFLDCKELKKVNIPDTVKRIGGRAFRGTAITSVTLPASLKYFGDEDEGPVFENCKNLKKVVFTDNKADVLRIDYSTFKNCTSLKKVYLPKSVKKIYINDNAFRNCKKLTKVYNTGNIVEIGAETFRGCKSLTSFTISNKVEEIGKKAFYGCTKLKKVTVNSKKKAPVIGKKAFGKTANGIKFIAKNEKAAKSWKTALKKSGLKNMKVRYVKYVTV